MRLTRPGGRSSRCNIRHRRAVVAGATTWAELVLAVRAKGAAGGGDVVNHFAGAEIGDLAGAWTGQVAGWARTLLAWAWSWMASAGWRISRGEAEPIAPSHGL